MPDHILPQFLDSTMLNCFRTCNQRFFNEFILGLRPAEISIHLHARAAFRGALDRFSHNFWPKQMDQKTAIRQPLPKFLELSGHSPPSKRTPTIHESRWNAGNDA